MIEKKRIYKSALALMAAAVVAGGMTSCTEDTNTNGFQTWQDYEFTPLSEKQKEVIAYLPKNVIIAHRGSEFWAPEESEAAMRWARNMGADYIECDLQMTKDGVVLALHDDSMLRTTDIETIYPTRMNDFTSAFTFDELLKLDIGTWFNAEHPEQARESFVGLDMLCLEDVLAIAEGMRIKRNPDGTRVVERDAEGNYLRTVYEPDPADNGNRPGVYIETKSPFSFPGIEEKLREILVRWGWYADDIKDLKVIPWKDGKKGEVDIANTPARIIMQTFENAGLSRIIEVFPRPIPTLYLTADVVSTPATTAALINFAIETGATIYGPNIDYITGYPTSINPWQVQMIRKAGLPIHAWSFNTAEQYKKYAGPWCDLDGNPTPDDNALDGSFTNVTDLTIRFYKETMAGTNYFRSNASVRELGYDYPDDIHAGKTLRDPKQVLTDLGYGYTGSYMDNYDR